ncbi:hypothetical protein FHG87_025692, partial [Trinorchestia longiramus]
VEEENCVQCNGQVEETIQHLVLECSKYELNRENFIGMVREQYGENQWNARCTEEDFSTSYLVGLYEEGNLTVVNAIDSFLVDLLPSSGRVRFHHSQLIST